MLELPDSSHFAALLDDPRFYAVLGVAILSGVARGFSGFGSALIYIPLVSAIYEPKIASASFILMDFFCTAPIAWRLYPLSNKREIWPLTAAAALTIPLGAMLLLYVDPEPLRWMIGVIIFALLAVLVSGWRFPGKPTLRSRSASDSSPAFSAAPCNSSVRSRSSTGWAARTRPRSYARTSWSSFSQAP